MNKIIYNFICNNFLNYKTGPTRTYVALCILSTAVNFSESENCVRALSTHKISCIWGKPDPILRPASEPFGISIIILSFYHLSYFKLSKYTKLGLGLQLGCRRTIFQLIWMYHILSLDMLLKVDLIQWNGWHNEWWVDITMDWVTSQSPWARPSVAWVRCPRPATRAPPCCASGWSPGRGARGTAAAVLRSPALSTECPETILVFTTFHKISAIYQKLGQF